MRRMWDTFRGPQRLAEHKHVHLGLILYAITVAKDLQLPILYSSTRYQKGHVFRLYRSRFSVTAVGLVSAQRRHCGRIERRSIKDAKARETGGVSK